MDLGTIPVFDWRVDEGTNGSGSGIKPAYTPPPRVERRLIHNTMFG